jgi:hypothetical protein
MHAGPAAWKAGRGPAVERRSCYVLRTLDDRRVDRMLRSLNAAGCTGGLRRGGCACSGGVRARDEGRVDGPQGDWGGAGAHGCIQDLLMDACFQDLQRRTIHAAGRKRGGGEDTGRERCWCELRAGS